MIAIKGKRNRIARFGSGNQHHKKINLPALEIFIDEVFGGGGNFKPM